MLRWVGVIFCGEEKLGRAGGRALRGHLHGNDVGRTPDMCFLVLDAPRADEVAKVPTAIFDLLVLAHSRRERKRLLESGGDANSETCRWVGETGQRRAHPRGSVGDEAGGREPAVTGWRGRGRAGAAAGGGTRG